MAQVTWATPILLPKKERQEKREAEGGGGMMGNRGGEQRVDGATVQRNGEKRLCLSQGNDHPLFLNTMAKQ